MEDEKASLWEHVGALRITLLKMLCLIAGSIVFCFIFYDSLIGFLKIPFGLPKGNDVVVEKLVPIRVRNSSNQLITYSIPAGSIPLLENGKGVHKTSKNNLYSIEPGGVFLYSEVAHPSSTLVLLGPLEGILMAMKVSFWAGIILSSPLWSFFLMQFVFPALRKNEKAIAIFFALLSFILISLGGLFAFFITIPFANSYLASFNEALGPNLWSLENYLNYTLFLIFANGAAFEIAAVGIFLVHLGFVSAETLIAYRREAILGAFIVATLLTPPDVLTQLFLAIPLIALYEATILFARIREKGTIS